MKLFKLKVVHEGTTYDEYCVARHMSHVKPEDGIGDVIAVELVGEVTIVEYDVALNPYHKKQDDGA
jgi:hypothetical protein